MPGSVAFGPSSLGSHVLAPAEFATNQHCPNCPLRRLVGCIRPRTTTGAPPRAGHWPQAGRLRGRRAPHGSQVHDGSIDTSRKAPPLRQTRSVTGLVAGEIWVVGVPISNIIEIPSHNQNEGPTTPPSPDRWRVVRPLALQTAVSFVANATLWLAARGGVGPSAATLSERFQTRFCFGSSRLLS